MSDPQVYEHLRQLADSWGLAIMTGLFGFLCLWPFRPGGKRDADEAAHMIFEEADNG